MPRFICSIALLGYAATFAFAGVWTQVSFMLLVGQLYQACLDGINTVPLNCAGDGLALYNLLFWCLLGNRRDQAGLELAVRVYTSWAASASLAAPIEHSLPMVMCSCSTVFPFVLIVLAIRFECS